MTDSASPGCRKILLQRLAYRERYLREQDPIATDRLLWQAQTFRHLVHLLPGESILELGADGGAFTAALATVVRQRNPIVAALFAPDRHPMKSIPEGVECLCIEELPGPLCGRRFRHIVINCLLNRENVGYLLGIVHSLLEEGGHCVMFEPNAWNPYFIARNGLRRLFRLATPEALLNRREMYELLSEIGFISIFGRFSDILYPPLLWNPTLIWFFRHLSVVLENAPLICSLSGRLILHAQKPPAKRPAAPVPLTIHACLHDAVSVVIPCHNEAPNLRPIIAGLLGFYSDYICQIVLVDDNSQDGTRELLAELAKEEPRITAIFRQPPNGVGLALRDGLAQVRGRYTLMMDCDFLHILPEMEDLFDAAAAGHDVVFGSRFSRHSVLVNYPFGKILANRFFHLLARLIWRQPLRDVTNNLRLVQSERLRCLVITEPGFAANAEIGLQLLLAARSAEDVPISWINRSFDMGYSSFRIFRAGGGYVRALWHTLRRHRDKTPPDGQAEPQDRRK